MGARKSARSSAHPSSPPHLIIYIGARKSAQGGLPLRNARNAARTGRRISCGTSETKVAPPSTHPSSLPHLIIYMGARKSARSSAHPSSPPHLIIYIGARKSAQGGLPLRNARNAARTGRRISCGTSETKVAPPSTHPSSLPHLIIYMGARKSARSSAHPSSPHSRPCTPLQAEAFHPLGRRLAVRGKVASQEAATPRTGGAKFPPVWKFLSSRVEIFFLPCGNFPPPVWKFSSSRVEIFLLPCGNFPPPVRKFSSSRMEVFTPRKGLENRVYYLFIVSPSKISSL